MSMEKIAMARHVQKNTRVPHVHRLWYFLLKISFAMVALGCVGSLLSKGIEASSDVMQ